MGGAGGRQGATVDLGGGSSSGGDGGGRAPPGGGSVQTRLEAIEREMGEVADLQAQLQQRARDLVLERERLLKAADEEAWRSSRRDWGGSFPWDARTLQALQTLGHRQFRPLQREVVNAVMGGRDTLCILPAGGGKSLCYQLPVLAAKEGQRGFAVVVSPLLALIGDQVSHLRRVGVHCAALTSVDKDSESSTYAAMVNPECSLKILYVTPERVAKSKRFMSKLEKAHEGGFVRLFAVDEAHCCSAWGHDFRTDYQALVILKRRFEAVPLLALTATATREVQRDIKEMLGLQLCETFRSSVDRKNLFYEVLAKESALPAACKQVHDWIEERFGADKENTCGIVYCFSRKETEQVCDELRNLGVRALYYHADLENHERVRVFQSWVSGHVNVIVCTVAFGMGIDKANVRFVVHFTLAKSMENFYQESGRAGRDGNQSYCMVLWRPQDLFRQSTIACTEKSWPRNLYKMARFCQSQSCRRASISQHFQEEATCVAMCDVCSRRSVSQSRGDVSEACEPTDVSACYRDIVGIIRNADAEHERLTLRKLINLWKKGMNTKTKESLKSRSQEERQSFCEHIVVELLLEGYICEDMGWNAYSTTSYLKVGTRIPRGVILVPPHGQQSGAAGPGPKAAPSAKATGTGTGTKRDRPIDLT